MLTVADRGVKFAKILLTSYVNAPISIKLKRDVWASGIATY